MADDTYRIADMVGMSKSRLELSVGSLGGGNHFIEVGRGPEDADNYMWITIHSGSRNFGKMVADFYQNKAVEYSGRKAGVAKGMEYMPTSDYMSGMMVAQRYAQLNRVAMMTNIIDALNCTLVEEINCTHNYISERDHIIRKGAVSAHVGDKIILPFNREDGIWVLSGKGNKDWNLSAPHGAGRQMSRSQAKKMMTQKYVDDKMSESGVYSSFNPIDEAPDAYKPAKDIQKFVADTAKYEFSIKPIVNIKG
jgi:RNA-splicing ligase RtcB